MAVNLDRKELQEKMVWMAFLVMLVIEERMVYQEITLQLHCHLMANVTHAPSDPRATLAHQVHKAQLVAEA